MQHTMTHFILAHCITDKVSTAPINRHSELLAGIKVFFIISSLMENLN